MGTAVSNRLVIRPENRQRPVRRWLRPGRKSRAAGYLYISGACVYLGIFVLYPIARSVWLSLTNQSLLGTGHYVGLSNYRALIRDGSLQQSLAVTAIYVICVSAFAMAVGLGSALFVDRLRTARTLVRTVLTLPWVIPTLVIGLLFSVILSVHTGVVNSILTDLGLGRVGWLTSDRMALLSVILVTVWNLFPFAMLVSLAALQSVPTEYYEAAMLDGASYLVIVRRIILPYIRPTLHVVGLFLVIWAFQQFQIIWLLTEGGPINGTNVLIIDLYKTAFVGDQIGTAAAIGVVGLVASTLVTLLFFAVDSPMRRKVR
jgi:multiple sugar transport system permease protein